MYHLIQELSGRCLTTAVCFSNGSIPQSLKYIGHFLHSIVIFVIHSCLPFFIIRPVSIFVHTSLI